MKLARAGYKSYVVLRLRHENQSPSKTAEELDKILRPLYAGIQFGTMGRPSSPPVRIAVRLFGLADEVAVLGKLTELGYTLSAREIRGGIISTIKRPAVRRKKKL